MLATYGELPSKTFKFSLHMHVSRERKIMPPITKISPMSLPTPCRKFAYNFYDPANSNSYINPATACNQLVADIPSAGMLKNGAFCYCRK